MSEGPQLTAADEGRRRGLRRMRALALGLLLLAAVVYVLTPEDGGWGYVHATAEASMVGAIADWFAVTALFRHPLGLPIPHTALIPRRKQALGVSLQQFVTDNFLSEQVVHDQDDHTEISERIESSRWTDPAHCARVIHPGCRRASRLALARVDDTDVAALVVREPIHAARRARPSPTAAGPAGRRVPSATGRRHGLDRPGADRGGRLSLTNNDRR